MEKYLKFVRELVKGFQAFNISHVPREENVEADHFARLATAKEDLIPGGVMMQYLDAPSIAKPIDEVQIVEYDGTRADPIVKYVRDGEVPDDKGQSRKLRIKAARYALMGDVLYRRNFTLPYLRCLVSTEAEHDMAENTKNQINSSTNKTHEHIQVCTGLIPGLTTLEELGFKELRSDLQQDRSEV
ncbi:hypothetical protein Vadar_001111 [Vaccinium darrowii]|uniref:Uncharacterized protein n=1 Tax=Vaccinium darrowii TaxID=229202 RepID=A0ACB7YT84_9ERIC|nr:hypothetical protein Vadar_001111 [Vaccinium darrowii]